jgi:hypothetical protein
MGEEAYMMCVCVCVCVSGGRGRGVLAHGCMTTVQDTGAPQMPHRHTCTHTCTERETSIGELVLVYHCGVGQLLCVSR